MEVTYALLFGFIAVGVASLIWRDKRRYDRTNEHGVQQYRNYWNKIKGESFDTLLSGMGYLGLFAGIFVLLAMDPPLLIWLLVIGPIIYAVKSRGRSKQ